MKKRGVTEETVKELATKYNNLHTALQRNYTYKNNFINNVLQPYISKFNLQDNPLFQIEKAKKQSAEKEEEEPTVTKQEPATTVTIPQRIEERVNILEPNKSDLKKDILSSLKKFKIDGLYVDDLRNKYKNLYDSVQGSLSTSIDKEKTLKSIDDILPSVEEKQFFDITLQVLPLLYTDIKKDKNFSNLNKSIETYNYNQAYTDLYNLLEPREEKIDRHLLKEFALRPVLVQGGTDQNKALLDAYTAYATNFLEHKKDEKTALIPQLYTSLTTLITKLPIPTDKNDNKGREKLNFDEQTRSDQLVKYNKTIDTLLTNLQSNITALSTEATIVELPDIINPLKTYKYLTREDIDIISSEYNEIYNRSKTPNKNNLKQDFINYLSPRYIDPSTDKQYFENNFPIPTITQSRKSSVSSQQLRSPSIFGQQPYGYPQQSYGYQPYSPQASLLTAQADLKLLLDRRAMPLAHTLPIMFSILCVSIGILLSLYYIVNIITLTFKQGPQDAPLNNQTADFETIKSLNFFGGKFNYSYFLIFPLLAIAGVIGFIAMTFIAPQETPMPREVKGIVFVILLSSVTMLICQGVIHVQVGKSIRAVSRRLTFFNRYVCSRIYKNYTFLETIKDPKANIISVNLSIANALKLLTPDMSNQELAKAFYTLTMFYHYQKIGLRNTAIFEAFDLFNPTSLLTGGCSPGDYLPRYGTYIEDIGESIIRPGLVSQNITVPDKQLDEILALTSEWVTNTNGYANTLYPEDAFNAFIIMTILTLLVQILPFIILFFFYGDPDKYIITRGIHTFGDAVGLKFAVKERV